MILRYIGCSHLPTDAQLILFTLQATSKASIVQVTKSFHQELPLFSRQCSFLCPLQTKQKTDMQAVIDVERGYHSDRDNDLLDYQ